MSVTIAIDFGTSRTKLAYLNPTTGQPELMRLGQRDDPFIPSLFYLERDSERILLGDEAEAMLAADPAGVVDVLKRKLHETHVRANRRRETPQALLTRLLSALRERAGRELPALQRALADALYLTVPAIRSPKLDRVLRAAAEGAGFTDVTLIAEPVAAAQAWLAHADTMADSVVVFDCGGGTIDWAYLRREGEAFRLVAECPPGGDHVGGYDLDRELLSRLQDQLDDEGLEGWSGHEVELLQSIRVVKERYCRGLPLAPIRLAGQAWHLTEHDIERAITERFVHQACEGLKSYLDQVRGVNGSSLPPVLLVGGSARLKGLRESIEQACDCETAWWDRADYATVLGAVSNFEALSTAAASRRTEEADTAPDTEPTTPSPQQEPSARPAMPPVRDLHGQPADVVQHLQRETAEALGLPMVFLRHPLKDGGQGPEMLVIPPGRFLMGSPENEPERFNNESPQHPVTIAQPFAIGRFAVTFEEYDRFCAKTERDKPGDAGWGRGRRPVINVSWNNAVAYCVWLSQQTGRTYRLPSEAEWEYAARAGTKTAYWWGHSIDPSLVNYYPSPSFLEEIFGSSKARKQTLPVDYFQPNPFGLYQVHGNVWEWCEDCWHGEGGYAGAPTDGSAWSSSVFGARWMRGGSWDSTNCRAASRERSFHCNNDDQIDNDQIGFRVCCDILINDHKATEYGDADSQSTPNLLGGRYRDNGDGTVTDVKAGLQWMRCSLGQEWKGGTCVGKEKLFTWTEAKEAAEALNCQGGYAGYRDWHLPTAPELKSLVYCSSGEIYAVKNIFYGCAGKYDRPTINQSAFPNMQAFSFWSASEYSDTRGWSVSFILGTLDAGFYSDSRGNAVRLVRVGQ